jgi:hypothetical protein
MPDNVTQIVQNLGTVTAYGYAKHHGYEGSEDQFGEDQAHFAENATAVAQDRIAADESTENAREWATGGDAEIPGGGDVPGTQNNAKFYADSARQYIGAPRAAADPSGMTDTDSVYLYVGTTTSDFTNGHWYYWDGTEWADGGNDIVFITDDTLQYPGVAADAKAVHDALLYEPVAINTFTITAPSGGLAELGSTVTAVTLGYALNKTLTAPETLTLSDGGDPVSVLDDPSPIELTGLALSSDTTYTLTAADAGSPIHSPATASKAANLKFVNRICYGVAASGTVDNAFVNALSNKVLSTTKARTITVNAGSGQYIWYCVPTRLGACTFKVGGFDGGFEAAQTVSVTNASGYTENYYVYRSTNANLGSTTVVVS